MRGVTRGGYFRSGIQLSSRCQAVERLGGDRPYPSHTCSMCGWTGPRHKVVLGRQPGRLAEPDALGAAAQARQVGAPR